MQETITVPPDSTAIVLDAFGGCDKPDCHGEMLVRVHAISVNPIEWKVREGFGLPRFAWRRTLGARPILGLDFADNHVQLCRYRGSHIVFRKAPPWPHHANFARAP